MKVAIQRISLASLGKIGCLLGIVAAFLPSLLCGLLGVGLIGIVSRWLESWQELTVSVLGQEIARSGLGQCLGLEVAADLLKTVASVSGATLFLVVLALALATGLFLALMAILLGLVYNLLAAGTGGLVVEMEAIEQAKSAEPGARQQGAGDRRGDHPPQEL